MVVVLGGGGVCDRLLSPSLKMKMYYEIKFCVLVHLKKVSMEWVHYFCKGSPQARDEISQPVAHVMLHRMTIFFSP